MLSPNYLLVHSSKYDDLLKELKIACEKIFGSDNSDLNGIQALARIVNNKHYNRIKSLVDASVAEGAEVFMGGKFIDSDNYISPTVLTNVTPESVIFQEEIFGPVLAVQTFRTVDEAIEKANNTPFGLSGGVWTDKGAKAFHVSERIKAGVVWTNTFNKFDPASPFGGYKESGFGREGGRHGLEAYLNVIEAGRIR